MIWRLLRLCTVCTFCTLGCAWTKPSWDYQSTEVYREYRREQLLWLKYRHEPIRAHRYSTREPR